MNPLRVSCQISANQREGEAKSNVKVNKHWKTRAKSNDAIPIIISSNQHFASIFRWIYLNSKDVVASSRSVPAPLPERPGELARRLTNLPHLTVQEPYFKFFQSGEKKIQNFTQIENVSKLDIYPAWPMYVLQNWTGNIIPHSLLLSVLKSVNFRNFADLYLRSLKSISFNFGTFTNFKALFSVVSTDFP